MNRISRVSNHKQGVWLTSVLLMLALVLSACATSAAPTAPAAVTSPPQATSAPVATTAPLANPTSAAIPNTGAEASVNVASNPAFGQILVDGKGMTLYAFTKDGPNQSNCTGGCLKAWPPLLTQGNPAAGPGVDASLLGTTTLADGSKIVTYNKMPLYYWAGDTKPGDTNGQNVKNVWFVVSPQGEMIQTTASQPAATAAPASSGNGYGGGYSSASSSQAATINVSANPKLGDILVDGKGMTLYVYMKDGPDKSNCSGGCLQAWPPFLATSAPTLGSNVDASLVGTIQLPDGTTMVTYNHMPLYYFAKDAKPGDTTGQDVGGVWYTISPDGKPVEQ